MTMRYPLPELLAVFLCLGGGCSFLDPSLNRGESGQPDHSEGPSFLTLDEKTAEAAGIQVEVTRVTEVGEWLETTAVVSANETRRAHIRPLSQGVVRKVYVQKGGRVVRGGKLLAYDNVLMGELLGQLRSLQAQLRRSVVQEQQGLKLWERGKTLYQAEAISEKELDLRETEYRSAKETANSYRAEIAGTLEKLRRLGATDPQVQGVRERNKLESAGSNSLTVVTAPFSGTVIDYQVAEGEVVSPDRLLLTIADLSTVWVLADVYEQELASVGTGRKVEVVTDSYPGRKFAARVTYIDDVVDARTRTVKIRCLAENPERLLKPGMFASVRIEKDTARSAITVPVAAIQTIGEESVVFVQIESTRFEKRSVMTGGESEGRVVIEAGLSPGERVVTEGAFSLKSELTREALGGGHGQ